MWKSKYKCFVIKSRYACTKDKDLAQVYLLMKRASTYLDIDGSFGGLLKETIGTLEDFARHRSLQGESLYMATRKVLTTAYDTYTLFNSEFETVRSTLIDCIYKLQELEEIADRTSPLAGNEAGTEGYDSKAKCREIQIRATHATHDMSVSNCYDKYYHFDIDPFNKEEKIISLDTLDGGCVKITSNTKDAATLEWGNKKFYVELGTHVSTEECLMDNPLLSSDSLKLTFTYRKVPNYAGLWNMIASLGRDELDEKEEKYMLTARKKEILHFIDKAIGKGNTGLYVAKALLTEYNNWGTCEINCIQSFRHELLKGIERGCLAPDNHFGWEWMEVATKYNDPSGFMEDMELYYEVLDTAAKHGVVEAIDIMNSIWEPEQIIEDD